jgi:hypothetical protein
MSSVGGNARYRWPRRMASTASAESSTKSDTQATDLDLGVRIADGCVERIKVRLGIGCDANIVLRLGHALGDADEQRWHCWQRFQAMNALLACGSVLCARCYAPCSYAVNVAHVLFGSVCVLKKIGRDIMTPHSTRYLGRGNTQPITHTPTHDTVSFPHPCIELVGAGDQP